MSAVFVDPVKISSANVVFENLYSMVYDNLCPLPNPPREVKNVINDFYTDVNIVSVDEEDIEGSYFLSGYHDSDAVFYPFQVVEVVEAAFFLDTCAKWRVVLTCLEEYAKSVDNLELIENVNLWKVRLNLLTYF